MFQKNTITVFQDVCVPLRKRAIIFQWDSRLTLEAIKKKIIGIKKWGGTYFIFFFFYYSKDIIKTYEQNCSKDHSFFFFYPQ